MNEWIKKVLAQLKALWAKWSLVQKGILIGIVVVVVGALIAVSRLSARSGDVALFNATLSDEVIGNIQVRLDQENIDYTTGPTGTIFVRDKTTARRARAILIREDILPVTTDPWAIFDVDRWTTSDFLNDVNKRRAIVGQVEQTIKALDGVDDAKVNIDIPETSLFAAEQRPMTASVVVYPSGNSDVLRNRRSIEGIQKIVKFAVSGLLDENIAILNPNGEQVNNFDDMREIERVDIIARQNNEIMRQQNEYRVKILNSLQQVFTNDRVRDLDVKIEMDMSEKTVQSTEYSPIVLKTDNPDTPYDDSEQVPYLPISSETVTKVSKGTVYNPEGPTGVEGQNPPVYSDMSNAYTITEEKGEKVNNVINERHTQEVISPTVSRVTVSVAIDGKWDYVYDDKNQKIFENGKYKREFTPITEEQRLSAVRLIQGAIGYDRNRGDSVYVEPIEFDRTAQFAEEDALELRRAQTQRTIIYAAFGVVAVLLAFILFRTISREVERKRRLREEEILRQHQMEREKTLWEAEQAGMEVTMSVDERERAELQESAIALAKEHPEDVAMLIRTWLTEE